MYPKKKRKKKVKKIQQIKNNNNNNNRKSNKKKSGEKDVCLYAYFCCFTLSYVLNNKENFFFVLSRNINNMNWFNDGFLYIKSDQRRSSLIGEDWTEDIEETDERK